MTNLTPISPLRRFAYGMERGLRDDSTRGWHGLGCAGGLGEVTNLTPKSPLRRFAYGMERGLQDDGRVDGMDWAVPAAYAR